MTSLDDFRQQYPQYNDMSDEDLAGALHSKYYSDIPQDQFNDKIGLNQNTFQSDFRKGQTGELNPEASAVAATGDLVNSGISAVATPIGKALDYANPFLKNFSLLPQEGTAATKYIDNAASNVVRDGAQNIADAIDSPVTEDVASDFVKNHPNYAANVRGITNIIGGLGALEGGTGLARSGLDAMAENSALTAGESAPKFLPSPVRPFAAIKSANEALGNVTSTAYKKAEDLGANINQDVSPVAAQAVRRYTEIAANNGLPLDPNLHKQTNAVLNNFDKKADTGLNITTIENTRKRLSNIAAGNPAGTPNASDGSAARQAIKGIDNLYSTMATTPAILESGTPDAIDALKTGRAAHALESNHDTITEIARQGNGNPNALQSKFKSLFDDEDELSKFSPEQQQAISVIAHPKGADAILEGLGKVGFGGANNLHLPYFETAGIAGALAGGNPIIAASILGTVGMGTVANITRGRIVRGMVDNLLKDIESKSVPVDSTLGNSGFSPLRGQPLLSAPPYRVDPMGNVDTSPIATTNYGPNAGNVTEAKAPVAGIGTPDSGGVDVRGMQMRGGSELGRTAAQNGGQPIKPYENATSIDEIGSSVHSPEYENALQTLKNLSRKRGGAVLTPAQIRIINKIAKKTAAGRAT